MLSVNIASERAEINQGGDKVEEILFRSHLCGTNTVNEAAKIYQHEGTKFGEDLQCFTKMYSSEKTPDHIPWLFVLPPFLHSKWAQVHSLMFI